ncbi:hypothetical protein ABT322_17850 [Streptomyces flaveolus]|uniref:Uncharacterized protein n=1 Tax=Streptomyces flaveolus TaxID=67297 RepID=A0ABV1VHQ6_9ACTN
MIERAGGEAMVFRMSSGAVLPPEAVTRGSAVSRHAVYEPPFITDSSRPPSPVDYVAHLTELMKQGAYGDDAAYFMTAAVGMAAEAVAGMRQAPFWTGMQATARSPTSPLHGGLPAGHRARCHNWDS